MSTDRVNRRVDELRADYEGVVGGPFSHFYCPILRVDESAELCEGHIVNAAFGTADAWEPQRKDVDNFYGAMVESEFIGVVKHRRKTPFDIWTDPDSRRQFRPKLTVGEQQLGHYFPAQAAHVPGQTA